MKQGGGKAILAMI